MRTSSKASISSAGVTEVTSRSVPCAAAAAAASAIDASAAAASRSSVDLFRPFSPSMACMARASCGMPSTLRAYIGIPRALAACLSHVAPFTRALTASTADASSSWSVSTTRSSSSNDAMTSSSTSQSSSCG